MLMIHVMQAPGRTAWQVPKKAGRPVEYQGDINNPLLSQTDRTRIKRRIVNRKAARRLRERHQETLQHAQHKVGLHTLHSQVTIITCHSCLAKPFCKTPLANLSWPSLSG